jgi:hypothetical protein
MKTSENVVFCLVRLLVIFVCPKMFLYLPAEVSVLILIHPVCCNSPTHLCAVTNHPVDYSTELQHTDGELKHTGR